MTAIKTAARTIATSQGGKAQAFRFMMVGGMATVIQFGAYLALVDFLGVPAVVATIISYAISFVFNFFMTSRFTFQSGTNAKKGIGFVFSHLINLGLQTGLVALFKGIVGASYALVPALVICVPVNFLLVRFVFTHSKMQSSRK